MIKKMMDCFHDIPSADETSNTDQETGSTSISRNADASRKNFPLCCFSHETDLNPVREIMAEVVGTFILMFCVSGIIASTQLMRGEIGLLEYAATAGLSVVVVIFAIGPISGAHVNPAVTIAFAIFGHFPWPRVPLYIMAQIVGAVVATCVGKSIYCIKAELMVTRPILGLASAFWVEFLATFMIVFLAASLSREAQSVGHLSGFAIGIVIGLGVLITGPVSGGSMNPARSLGPAIVSWNFKDVWVYVTAPILGAIAGAFLYRFLRLKGRPGLATASPNSTFLTPSLGFGQNVRG